MKKINWLVVGVISIVVLLLLFGGGMMMGGWGYRGWGMIGGGWMGGRGMMGGISWMWIPTLFTIGLGIIIGWAIWGKK